MNGQKRCCGWLGDAVSAKPKTVLWVVLSATVVLAGAVREEVLGGRDRRRWEEGIGGAGRKGSAALGGGGRKGSAALGGRGRKWVGAGWEWEVLGVGFESRVQTAE
ncbi:uncharacterized protein DS421_1g00060 [Arachis hypogaea]|nr:uncharacterized protein DS421_1g00060 [Arachis hypogaea]